MSIFTATFDGISLSAGVAKTVWELGSGPDREAKVRAWSVSFKGVSTTGTPVKVEMRRADAGVTTATTLAGSNKDLRDPETSTMVFKHNTSTEGSGVLSSGEIHRVHPQGSLHVRYPAGSEWYLNRSGLANPFYRLRCTADEAVSATFFVEWEE